VSLPPQNVPLSRVDKLRRDEEDGEDTAEGLHLEFKQEAVRLVESGQRVSEAARSLWIVEQTLANWVKAHRAGKLRGSGRSAELTAEQIEIRRLRAELARVTMERDILGKATAFCEGQK
jgi:transposase